jgi:pectate lyase
MATRTDSFDRTDSSNLGSDWAEDSGDWSIVSNNVRQNTSGNSYRKLRWVGASMDSANYSVEVVARSAGITGIGAAARCAASSAVTYYGYVIFGGDRAYLVEITAGGEAILDTGSTISSNTNYTLRLEVDGSTLRGYLNGVLDVEATDASLSSGQPGIMAYGGNEAGTYVTTWTATDLGGAVVASMPAAFGRELHARSHANLRR